MIDWLRKDMIEPEIEIAGQVLPIALKRHSRARRLTLRLAPDGSEVRLTLPHWCSTKEAIAFVHARKEWLNAQLERIPENSPPEAGGTLLYRGRSLLIDWQEVARRMPVLGDSIVTLGGPRDKLAGRLQRWLEKEALAIMKQDLTLYCERADRATPQLRLSRAQRRWGSCSSGGTVRINWRLIQAPDFVRQSVVAHEVAHLVHFDHSPAFKALLQDVYGGPTTEADAWLREHGRELYASFG